MRPAAFGETARTAWVAPIDAFPAFRVEVAVPFASRRVQRESGPMPLVRVPLSAARKLVVSWEGDETVLAGRRFGHTASGKRALLETVIEAPDGTQASIFQLISKKLDEGPRSA